MVGVVLDDELIRLRSFLQGALQNQVSTRRGQPQSDVATVPGALCFGETAATGLLRANTGRALMVDFEVVTTEPQLATAMIASVRGLVSRGLYEAKTLVAMHPAIAMPIARIRGHGVRIDQRTDILIEGYPRSANVFTTTAFAMAQGRPVQVAHHVHAPAHVIAAVRAGIPSLVLVREPEDAVLRVVVYKQNVTIAQALRAYVRFYRPLLRWRHGFVIRRFPDVTTNLGAVVRRVNKRFGTDFAEFDHTAENAQVCFDAMDRHWRALADSAELVERYVNRPSEVRRRWVATLAPAYRAPDLRHLRYEADRLHAVLAEAGG